MDLLVTVLIGWLLLSLSVGILLGRAMRLADRRRAGVRHPEPADVAPTRRAG